jgi:Protein of unknown function (DUF4079)
VFKSNMNRCFSRPFLLIAITAAPNFCADAFVLIPPSRVATVLRSTKPNSLDTFSESNILPICDTPGGDNLSTPQPALSIANHFRKISTAGIVWAATAQIAMADSPDWGIFEGRTGSLLHPITMGSLFVFSLYTAYLGFQWRRQRTLGDEIGTLRKTLPNLDGAPSVLAALAAAKDANDLYKINSLNAALATEENIAALTAERKALAESGPRDKHFQQGAMLVLIGTCFAIEVSCALALCYWDFHRRTGHFLRRLYIFSFHSLNSFSGSA